VRSLASIHPGRIPGVRRALLLAWALHLRLYRWSRGRIGGRLVGLPVLVLTTRGRRSGLPRSHILTYLREGGTPYLCASNGGLPTHPAWFLNLRAHPEVEIEIGPARRRASARVLTGPERDRLFARFVAAYAGYGAYQRWTDRVIPIVALEPIPAPAIADPT